MADVAVSFARAVAAGRGGGADDAGGGLSDELHPRTAIPAIEYHRIAVVMMTRIRRMAQ